MSLKQVKSKIRSVSKTKKVTKAIEAVSAVKMRKTQEKALLGRPYARAALTILQKISAGVDVSSHALSKKRAVKHVCYIVVAGEKGLSGALNGNIFRAVERDIKEKKYDPRTVKIIAISKMSGEYFSNRGYEVIAKYVNIPDDVHASTARDIINEVVAKYRAHDFDKCYIAYSIFKSTFEQRAVVRRMLPVSKGAYDDVVNEIIPQKGMYADAKRLGHAEKPSVYTIEPDNDSVFEELLPHLINTMLYYALMETRASEHSARMVAMKNASDKADELSKDLNLAYNKERQALITREVSEIIGGMETISN